MSQSPKDEIKKDRDPDFSKPLKEQYIRLVLVFTSNRPLSEAYEIVIETMRKKPDSRKEQLDICQCDANHFANGLLYFARLIQENWFKEYGVTATQMIDMVCDYLLDPNPEAIKNSPPVALMLEFDPDKKGLERYLIERETTDKRELNSQEQLEAMKTDMKHFANGARYLASVMELHFKEFNLKEKEVIGKLCIFLRTTIRGQVKELDVIA